MFRKIMKPSSFSYMSHAGISTAKCVTDGMFVTWVDVHQLFGSQTVTDLGMTALLKQY